MTFVLASHQRYALAMMEANSSLGIFYAPGCGKTAIALSWAIKELSEHRIRDVLVVCPASLVGNWRSSIDKMAMFEGVSDGDVELLRQKVYVTSFQKVYRTTKTPIAHKDGAVTYKRTISLRKEVDKAWGAIFIDESHCIGSHKSVQTKACLALARRASHRYILTGTPVHGGGGAEDFSKLYGQIKFLEPDIWPNWTQFCNRYVVYFDRWHNPAEYSVDSCRALMRNHAIVARLEDCYDMPSSTDTEIPCELAERKVYKEVASGLIDKYDLTIDNNAGQYVKLLQICSGSLKNDAGTMSLKCSKDEALADILDSTDDKVVVFCNFRASVDRAEDVCRKAGRRVVVFDGRSKGETWREFQEGPADAIVAQYQSGGVGIDLYASATMVLFEPCLSALLMEQARARIMRKGQEKNCRYLMLSTPKTIEKRAWDTVRSGVDITNEMLARWARETPFQRGDHMDHTECFTIAVAIGVAALVLVCAAAVMCGGGEDEKEDGRLAEDARLLDRYGGSVTYCQRPNVELPTTAVVTPDDRVVLGGGFLQVSKEDGSMLVLRAEHVTGIALGR